MGYYIETLFAFEYNEQTKAIIEKEEYTDAIFELCGNEDSETLEECFIETDYKDKRIFYIQFYTKNSSSSYSVFENMTQEIVTCLNNICQQTEIAHMCDGLGDVSKHVGYEDPLWHEITIGEELNDVMSEGYLHDIFVLKREIEIYE